MHWISTVLNYKSSEQYKLHVNVCVCLFLLKIVRLPLFQINILVFVTKHFFSDIRWPSGMIDNERSRGPGFEPTQRHFFFFLLLLLNAFASLFSRYYSANRSYRRRHLDLSTFALGRKIL